ncbi:MAG: response regulator transcription factor [Fibrella sp.]|nr:response regulator transcription factor [Armatimonadota bacterium]
MPRRSGVSATGAPPRYALIVEGSKIDFYGARKMAVNAFIGTDEPTTVLIQGIQAAASNRLYCSPQLLPALIEAVGSGTMGSGAAKSANGAANRAEDDSTASQAALLSSREHEVALHAARGLSNDQIAVFLGISIPTVKFHLMHAFRKLDIQRRTQLYAYMPYLTSATEALLPK